MLFDTSSGVLPGLIFVCKGHSTTFGDMLVIAAAWVVGYHWLLVGRGQGRYWPSCNAEDGPTTEDDPAPHVSSAVTEKPRLGSGPTQQTKQQRHTSVYYVFTKCICIYTHTHTDKCKCFTDLVFFSMCCCCWTDKLVWLFATLDCSQPGSSVYGVSRQECWSG